MCVPGLLPAPPPGVLAVRAGAHTRPLQDQQPMTSRLQAAHAAGGAHQETTVALGFLLLGP